MSQPTPKTVSTTVDVVIPVLNEAHVLEKSVDTVRRFLGREFEHSWKLVLVDNGSTDGTAQVAQGIAEKHADVEFLQLQQKGRGRALRHAWLRSQAEIVCYMDVDLSTEMGYPLDSGDPNILWLGSRGLSVPVGDDRSIRRWVHGDCLLHKAVEEFSPAA